MMERKSGISFGDGIPAEMCVLSTVRVRGPAEAAELPSAWCCPRVVARERPAMAPLLGCILAGAAFKRDENTTLDPHTPLPFEVNLVDGLNSRPSSRFQTGRCSIGETRADRRCTRRERADAATPPYGGRNGPRSSCWSDHARRAPSLDRETLGAAAASFEFLTSCRQITRERIGSYLDRSLCFSCSSWSWSYQAMDRLRPERPA